MSVPTFEPSEDAMHQDNLRKTDPERAASVLNTACEWISLIARWMVPFMPAKGGAGSDLVGELGIVEIADPYTGTPVLAVPALRPDVTFIHAEASDAAGNVAGPSSPDFLWDFDAAIARAAGRVVVTVEEIVDSVAGRAMLFAHEVDAVVLAPGGAAPSAMPGRHPADLTRLRGYLADPASGPGPLLGQPS